MNIHINSLCNKKIKICMKVDKSYAIVGDIINYLIIVESQKSITCNNEKITNLKLINRLPLQLEFIKGTIEIDGESRKDLLLSNGINLSDIEFGVKKLIKFKVKVISGEKKIIYNKASLIYVCNMRKGFTYLANLISNNVCINVEKAEIEIRKICNVNNAFIGDIIKYKIILENLGTLEVVNTVVKDLLTKEVKLIDGIFKINNKVKKVDNLFKGIYIGNISINEKINIEYDVQVLENTCTGILSNNAIVEYDYLFKNNIIGSKCSDKSIKSISSIKLSSSIFKEFKVDGFLNISEERVKIKEINDIRAYIQVNDTHIVDVEYEDKNEYRRYKLIINGVLEEILEYTGLTEKEELYILQNNESFSTFLMLPKDFIIGTYINLEANIESIKYRIVNEKQYYRDINILIIAKIVK